MSQIATLILSAPRPNPTFPSTLQSLTRNLWLIPYVSYDYSRTGCYRNWRHAAEFVIRELFEKSVTHLLIFEDDIEIAVSPTWLLSQIRHHLPRDGRWITSLYTAACVPPPKRPGWFTAERLPKHASGALATLWPVGILNQFLGDPPHPEWTDRTDHAIGLFCRDQRIPYLMHSPSIVRHTAVGHDNSALIKPGGREEDRQCRTWLGDLLDSERR